MNTNHNRRWPTVLLVVSLAVNLLLVGFLFGSDQRLRGDRAMGPPHTQVGHFLRETEADRRSELTPLTRGYWQESRRAMRGLRSARRALNSAMAADPLDEAQIEQAMNAVDAALLQSSQASQRAMLTLIRALTPEERTRLASSGRRRASAGVRPQGRPGGPPGGREPRIPPQ